MRECPSPSEPEPGDIDEEGFMLGPNYEQIGQCNHCGEEAILGEECCDGGEVVPFT